MSKLTIEKFQKTILDHYHQTKRQLPWRKAVTPYKVVVSEIMLQQTQAERVIPKFNEFIKQFPSFTALAKAPLPSVLKAWSGLGYNRRAIALQKIAKIIIQKYKGKLPQDTETLDALPGIGPATAAAILTYSFNVPTVFIETNVRTVFIHFYFKNKTKVSDHDIEPLVHETVDLSNPREWYYALMDYGVKLKKEFKNPSRHSAHYTKQSKFQGSNRQLRGKIVKLLLTQPELTSDELSDLLNVGKEQIDHNLAQLAKEGFTIVP